MDHFDLNDIKDIDINIQITCFTKNPAFVKRVDKEDGRLCDGHEEVTDGQVHDEVVWRRPQVLVTAIHDI